MKKAILAPILSAFVIPGLGQIINRRPVKGLISLFLVMIFFVGGLLSLSKALEDSVASQPATGNTTYSFSQALADADLTLPLCFVGALALLWLLSVIDAFWEGRRLDLRE